MVVLPISNHTMGCLLLRWHPKPQIINSIYYGGIMKLAEALSIYREYRSVLVQQKRELSSELENAKAKEIVTGNEYWSEEAATLQLSLDETVRKFEENQEVLDRLTEQHCNAMNMESNRALADPENGLAAQMGKIMTTVARMCSGDIVPASDEKKVMEYDKDLYMRAKQAQIAMAKLKEKRKEYESLWDDDNAKEYDPEGVADNTEAAGELPPIPETGADAEMQSIDVCV